MLALPEGSDRFDERVNTTLKPSMLVGLERAMVTGNVALACVLEITLDGTPTLTTAWAETLLPRTTNPASAKSIARTRGARHTSNAAAIGHPR